MILYVIFGQRHERYPVEFAPEALDTIDQYSDDATPEWLQGRLIHRRESGEFRMVNIVPIKIDQAAIHNILTPSPVQGEIE